MLVGMLAGESPVGGTCPVATVVISGGGAGDQSVGSPEVKVHVGWVKTWSAPTGGRANRQVATKVNRSEASKTDHPTRIGGWGIWKCRDHNPLWSKASVVGEGTGYMQPNELPVVAEDDMSIQSANESTDPLVGCLGRSRRHSEGISYKPFR